MRLTILGSGSRGNATLVEAGGTRILIDAGLPPTDVRRRAESARGETLGHLDAVVITHAHGDHVAHARACAEHFAAPLYMTEATKRSGQVGAIPRTRTFGARAPFSVGAVEIRPCPVPHDAPQVALVFVAGDARAGLVTDLGWAHRELLAHLADCGTLLLEANHDERLLKCGPYPPEIQRRILSGAGHLSNAQTAEALAALRAGLREVVLMHLSQANNEPHLALEAARQAVADPRVRLRAAHQEIPTVVDVTPKAGQLPLPL